MITERLAWTLAHFIWQGALIAGIAASVLRHLRRETAQVRYAVSVTALMAMLAAPIATFVFYSSAGIAFQRLIRFAIYKLDPSVVLKLSFRSTNTSAWMQWLIAIWLVGVAISAVRWTLGWQATRRLVQTATATVPVEVLVLFDRMKLLLNFSRPICLLLSTRIDGPAAAGWLRPWFCCR
jgi:hypothetical protein